MFPQLTVYNHEGGPCYRCLFPRPPPPETVTNCSDGGVLGVGELGTAINSKVWSKMHHGAYLQEIIFENYYLWCVSILYQNWKFLLFLFFVVAYSWMLLYLSWGIEWDGIMFCKCHFVVRQFNATVRTFFISKIKRKLSHLNYLLCGKFIYRNTEL